MNGFWKKIRPHVVAILVAYHVVGVFVLGFPAPAGVMKRSMWKEATVQNEIHVWASRFRQLGIDVSDGGLEQWAWDFSVDLLAVRSVFIKPFSRYADWFGVKQNWRMFSAPDRFPSTLHIDVYEDDAWKPIYACRSETATWRRPIFDNNRVRRIVFLHAWKQYSRHYKDFVRWVARGAAADFPRAKKVRVRHFSYKTLEPEEMRAGKAVDGKWTDERVVDLEKYR